MRRTLLVLGALLATAVGAGWWFASEPPSAAQVEWILHYPGSAFADSLDTHRDLVENAPSHVRVVMVVSNEADGHAVREALGGGSNHDVVQVAGTISPWARDRYIVFQRNGVPHCMVLPEAAVPEVLRGDARVPDALRATHPELVIVRTPFAPQGGDVIVTARGVIMSLASLAGTARRTGAREHVVVRKLERHFGRSLVVVGREGRTRLPPHVDVYIANAGNGRLLLSDPRLMVPQEQNTTHGNLGTFGRNHNLRVAEELDAIRTQLRSAGFEVQRIPGLFADASMPGQLTPTALSYTNVIREGRTVFVPSYGLPAFDRAGHDVWEGLGFRSVPIRARVPVRNGGAVRCMTNRFPGESDI